MLSKLDKVWEITDPAEMFDAYLYHSYLYYVLYTNEIKDHDYDELCRKLHDVWGAVEHKYKHLSDLSALAAGTGFHINEYPAYIRDWAEERGHEDACG